MTERTFILGLAFTIVFGCFGEKTLACFSSAPSDNLNTQARKNAFIKDFNQAQAIFTGKVIAIDDYEVKFKVDTVWKGNLTEEFTMSTGTIKLENGGSMSRTCDYEFKDGKSYLVFAYKLPPPLYYENAPLFSEKRLNGQDRLLVTYMTNRTKPLEEAEQGIENLNQIEKPKKTKMKKQGS